MGQRRRQQAPAHDIEPVGRNAEKELQPGPFTSGGFTLVSTPNAETALPRSPQPNVSRKDAKVAKEILLKNKKLRVCCAGFATQGL